MHHVANTGVFNHLLEIFDEWFETRLFTTRYCSVEVYQQGQEDIICYVKAFHSIVNQQLTSLGEKDKELHMAHLQKSGNCCALCGAGDRTYPAFFMHCAGKCGRVIGGRMRYFTDRELRQVWCTHCFMALSPREIHDGIEVKRDTLIERECGSEAKELVCFIERVSFSGLLV